MSHFAPANPLCGAGDAKPADRRAAAKSRIVLTPSWVVSSSDSPPRRAPMNLLLSSQLERMAEQFIGSRTSAIASWPTLVGYLQIKHPDAVWADLLMLDITRDAPAMAGWLIEEFAAAPKATKSFRLWFGIAEFQGDDAVAVMGLTVRSSSWDCINLAPLPLLAHLSAIRSELSDETRWLINAGLALPVVMILIAEALRTMPPAAVLRTAPSCAVECGFECGEGIPLGTVTPKGFTPRSDW